jgi:hypothetical protein
LMMLITVSVYEYLRSKHKKTSKNKSQRFDFR